MYILHMHYRIYIYYINIIIYYACVYILLYLYYNIIYIFMYILNTLYASNVGGGAFVI